MNGLVKRTVATLLWMCAIAVKTQAVSAGCECIVFDNTYGKEYGIFTSPNWPTPYKDNIDCVLYSFVAAEDEIIEITFDEFDIQKTNLECIFGDFVKLFLHLDEAAVNEKTPWNLILCGKVVDIEQTHYSSASALIFEFHTDWRRGNNTGFRGTYRFLSRRLFQTEGDLLEGSRCDYDFNVTSSNRTSGFFYSPQYPSTYPKEAVCSYRFTGRSNERVKIVFELIRLQRGDLSCLNSPDVIIVYDSSNASGPVIGQLCNTNTFVELVSTGPNLLIQFVSRSHFPGQGFKASFTFEDIPSTADLMGLPSMEPAKKTGPTTTTPPSTTCDEHFSSDSEKSGNFSSPDYPEPYSAGLHCIYHFSGRGKERVQVLFTDFELHQPQEAAKDCSGSDAVMVFITINGQKERVENFCGNKLPAQLMSNGPSMTVEFRSLRATHTARGFRAIFRFVTNFGITTGDQDKQSVCGFIFNSSENSNGTFMSPNWPGYYPRDTECHYFFLGRTNEKVRLTFAYFDVDGIPSCTSETASDYVEFSNFRTVDRKLPRHCGIKTPTQIESDGDFFRVTFKSNDKFDGTGFEAFYQFLSIEDPYQVKKRVSSHGCSLQSLPFLPVFLIFLILKHTISASFQKT